MKPAATSEKPVSNFILRLVGANKVHHPLSPSNRLIQGRKLARLRLLAV
jgi:hypothetical protein